MRRSLFIRLAALEQRDLWTDNEVVNHSQHGWQ